MNEPVSSGTAAPFPRGSVVALVRRLPAYARLAWALSRDERIPAARRAALLGAVAYLVSPIDLVPGIIPLVGQLDDVLVVLAALRLALSGLTDAQREEHLRLAGLAKADLEADVAALEDATRWLAVHGLRAGRRVARTATEIGIDLSRGALKVSRVGASAIVAGARSWRSHRQR
jgi:uncharacterized membrane protein YkvA (DUF1232 family)